MPFTISFITLHINPQTVVEIKGKNMEQEVYDGLEEEDGVIYLDTLNAGDGDVIHEFSYAVRHF